jgi:hypothetical protein
MKPFGSDGGVGEAEFWKAANDDAVDIIITDHEDDRFEQQKVGVIDTYTLTSYLLAGREDVETVYTYLSEWADAPYEQISKTLSPNPNDPTTADNLREWYPDQVKELITEYLLSVLPKP